MPGPSGTAAPSSSPHRLTPALEVPVLPVEPVDAANLVVSATTSVQITMSTSTDNEDDAAEELAETEQEKESQVLQREPVETELMDEDRSDVGERVEGVEEDE